MPTVTQLEADLEAARIAEKQAAVAAVEQQKKRDHELKEIERGQAGELRALSEMADKVFAVKATPSSRPAPEIRGLARQFLHTGIDVFAVDALATDRVFGDRFGISRRAGQLLVRFAAIGVRDETLWAQADAIEVRGWALAVQRAKVLAGEIS
jgi:hypothetical protein